MASGTPVICSSLTSLPEVAGDACLYVRDFTPQEVATQIESAIAKGATRDALRSAGRERVKLFAWEDAARKAAQVYLEVIERPAPSSLAQRRAFSTLIGAQLTAEAHAQHLQGLLDHAGQGAS
jgi:hypothetical protein